MRSFRTNDDFWIIVFGGEVFFADDLVLKDETLERLVESGDLQVTFDLANYLPEDKVAQTIEVPRTVILAAAVLQAAVVISTYVTSDADAADNPSTPL